ncbi:MAG: hypothetical protein GYA21_13245 [Myxococcales bacterium]|nr:hypothetical protein [Myxococcales bacterium]
MLLLVVWCFPGGVSAKKKELRQVVIQEATRVEGKVHKPEVWYLLPRSNLNFESLNVQRKLSPRIEEETKKAPF